MSRRNFEEIRQVWTCLGMCRRDKRRWLSRVKHPPKNCHLFMGGVLRPNFWTHYREWHDLQGNHLSFKSDLLIRPQEDENRMVRRHYWACPEESSSIEAAPHLNRKSPFWKTVRPKKVMFQKVWNLSWVKSQAWIDVKLEIWTWIKWHRDNFISISEL